MDLGIHVVSFTDQETREIGPTLARTGRAAEAAGVSTLSLMRLVAGYAAPTPATCSRRRQTTLPTSSTCCPGTATTSAATRPRSA